MVHFPKSAGSALLTHLSDALGGQLYADRRHDPLGPHSSEVVKALPEGIVGVFGHFHPHVYPLPHAFRATFLREPVSNLISIYFYWKVVAPQGNPIHDRFLEERPTLEAFAQHPKMSVLMSSIYFGGVDMEIFDFIGFYDELQADSRRLCNLIGVPAAMIARVNVTPHDVQRGEVEADNRLMQRLRDLLAADIGFYEAVQARRRHVGRADEKWQRQPNQYS